MCFQFVQNTSNTFWQTILKKVNIVTKRGLEQQINKWISSQYETKHHDKLWFLEFLSQDFHFNLQRIVQNLIVILQTEKSIVMDIFIAVQHIWIY